jgi:triosephosphate isomerase
MHKENTMKRKPIVGMSLKIYVNRMEEAKTLAKEMKKRLGQMEDLDLFLIPSMGTLYPVAEILKDSAIRYGVQNIAPKAQGAYTGEFSIESAEDLSCSLVELGHAERKALFRETPEMINEKVHLTLHYHMWPIVCIGEREKGEGRKEALKDQILSYMKGISPERFKDIVLAYEPEWAIGQPEPAEASYVHESMALIRDIVREHFGEKASSAVRLIYGGSAKKETALEIAQSEDVDGLFIGRFGHEMDNLEAIVRNVRKAKEGV